ncbi:MAG: hypothetical protein WDO68_10850 [Gammaproteobacteria bacterium]
MPDTANPPSPATVSTERELRYDFSTFQVLIRLLHLRAQVRHWAGYGVFPDLNPGRINDLIWALQGIEFAAEAEGLKAYAQVCRLLATDLDALPRDAVAHGALLQELSEWIVSSERYLRYPGNAGAVADLVGRLSVFSGKLPLSQDDQSSLFRALLQPG